MSLLAKNLKDIAHNNHFWGRVFIFVSLLFSSLGFGLYLYWLLKYHEKDNPGYGTIQLHSKKSNAIYYAALTFKTLSGVLTIISFLYHMSHHKHADMAEKLVKTQQTKFPAFDL